MRVLRKVTTKFFKKTIISKGYGYYTPQETSLCKIKVIFDEVNLLRDLDGEKTKEIIIGDSDEPINRIIEDCIRTMKKNEECIMEFRQWDIFVSNNFELKESVETSTEQVNNSLHLTAKDDSSDKVTICFQLLSFTREPEVWELSSAEKWLRANYHKQKGLELYVHRAYKYAFRRFGLALKYIISLEHDVSSDHKECMDVKGLKKSCYLNMAGCQMVNHNFESVLINSTKALEIKPIDVRALYRRGTAYLKLQEYEKSKEDLNAAQQLEPENKAIAKQLQILRNKVCELNQFYASVMKTFFS